jgi:transglutaminase-like putative cysteine protease
MKVMSGSLRMPVAAAFATITASICLGPAFLIGSWFLPTAFGVLLVGAGCEVARRLSASRSTVPLGGLAALALYLLWRYGNDQAVLGVIPTSGSVDQLGKLASSGRDDINQYAAPIGVSPGIELLTVAGVGLIALVVDTLAVTWRRAALAGLPLLVLYTVPTAVAPEGVSWVAFAIAGIAFLTLLLAESRERVSRWGRPMRFSVARENWQPQVDPSPLGQVGRRVGATALGLALVVPAVLPDLTVSSIGFGSGGFGRGGGGDPVAVFNPIIDLGQNLRQGADTPVIRYSGKPTYLRMVGLDEFTGAKWQPSSLEVSRNDNDAEDGLPLPPGLSGTTERHLRHYSIEIFDFSQAWLPLPYPTRKVSDIDGTWLYDPATFNVFGENSSTRQISYKVSALDVTYSPEALRTAGAAPSSLRKYLQVPSDIDPRVLAQAREVTTGQPTGYDQALALQTWLRDPNEFTYNQTVDASVGDGNGSQAILAFLQTRKGYCVHFASTMAVMARQLGIPARVAVGFALGHTVQGKQVVGLHELHAWPELFFQGSGWVPFEPTPGGPASQPPSWARLAPGGDQPTDQPTGQASGSNSPNPRASEGLTPGAIRALDRETTGRGRGGVGAGPVRVPVLPFVLTLVALVLLAVPSVTRLLVRRHRWREPGTPTEHALAAWAELHDTLIDHGYDWDPADPPRRGAARLVAARHLIGDPVHALDRLAAAVERARYASEMSPVGDLRADVDTVRVALSDGAGRWERWRARLLPRSTRAVSTALSEKTADALDAVDRAVARVTLRLHLRRT